MILMMGTSHAFARNAGGTRGLSIENLEQTAELQVKSVGRNLGLDERDTEKLTEATLESRRNLMDAIMKRMAESVEDNTVLMSGVYAMQAKERKTLIEEVSDFLNKGQRQQVGQTLVSYNRPWDSYILELNNLGLSPEVRATAEDRLIDFVTQNSPIRDEGYQNGDLSFVDKRMVGSKQALDRDLKEILPGPKYVIWTKNTEFRFRGPQRRGSRPLRRSDSPFRKIYLKTPRKSASHSLAFGDRIGGRSWGPLADDLDLVDRPVA